MKFNTNFYLLAIVLLYTYLLFFHYFLADLHNTPLKSFVHIFIFHIFVFLKYLQRIFLFQILQKI